MSSKRIALVAVLIVGMFAVFSVPASAGEPISAIGVIKEVQGPGPSGTYVINVTCTGRDGGSFDLDVTTEQQSGLRVPQGDTTCTVTEVEDLGALAISYACEEIVEGATCLDDQTVFFDGGFPGAFAEVTVTNDFREPATTTSTVAAPTTPPTTSAAVAPAATVRPAAVAAAPIQAPPTLTG